VGKELETLLGRLAAMARAVGIHLVLATQRPSANVITGIIKSNIPARIAFMVASQIDSRIIIDEMGAEKLLGKGDMLFVSSWNPASIRIQGAFMSDDEVERVVAFAKTQGDPDYLDEAFFEEDDDHASNGDEEGDFDDGSDEALMEKALNIVRERQSASASYLQRRLKIGYNRAARLVEQMEDLGYVGPARGSKPRELIRLPD
ncbi:MAG: DNA translocase FtsK, partial [Sphaerochaetaceae bacterium]